ncbi:hypothetical protein K402DRAFT_420397 [Aulographum hederae CBS 113979]|uniref:CFEM domain-containing protein n=1 Tax=Aulographum hederae CBS 113979 TaxID=1176131 RepID=A0A6G1H281_9PEZI|nr:hypothetical protein K402DRAFT_420397 [Aulographum hederae CBS 113979]
MKLIITLLVALFALLVAAQNIAGLPECSLHCFEQSVPQAGCDLADQVCQCTTQKTKITQLVTPCVVRDCPHEDAMKVQPASDTICERVLAAASASASSSAAETVPAAVTLVPTIITSVVPTVYTSTQLNFTTYPAGNSSGLVGTGSQVLVISSTMAVNMTVTSTITPTKSSGGSGTSTTSGSASSSSTTGGAAVVAGNGVALGAVGAMLWAVGMAV